MQIPHAPDQCRVRLEVLYRVTNTTQVLRFAFFTVGKKLKSIFQRSQFHFQMQGSPHPSRIGILQNVFSKFAGKHNHIMSAASQAIGNFLAPLLVSPTAGGGIEIGKE